MTDLKKLRELAENATPGPWEDYYETGIRPCVMAYDENDKGLRSVRAYVADTQFSPDRAYIAAANPETVLALIDRIEKLEAQLKEANEVIDDLMLRWNQQGGLALHDAKARVYLKKWEGK